MVYHLLQIYVNFKNNKIQYNDVDTNVYKSLF